MFHLPFSEPPPDPSKPNQPRPQQKPGRRIGNRVVSIVQFLDFCWRKSTIINADVAWDPNKIFNSASVDV
jgi:hypothetical protein